MQKNHTIVQGDSYFIKVPVTLDGVGVRVQGMTFKFTVRSAPIDLTVPPLIAKSTAAGTILPLDPTSVYVVGAQADTVNMDAGRYLWDIEATTPAGDIYTLERGTFSVVQQVSI